MSNSLIFVSIAAFRDPELVPTLQSMFDNADHPENLHVCIGWQYAKDEIHQLDKYKSNSNVSIISVPYDKTDGTCWMRNKIQKRYNNENYYAQFDSHHRFVTGWDTIAISMLEELRNGGVEKPLLTAYLPSYNPFNDPEDRSSEIWKLNWDRFIPESPFFVLPAAATEKELQQPIPTRFFSGHFVFCDGSFVNEVPYDPNLFFHGEEGSLAVRAYTWGYDSFIPNKQIAFHEYTREYRVGLKVWDTNSNWIDLNNKSHERHKKLFGMDGKEKENLGIYGFGPIRSLEDYQRFAGIRFSDRSVQQCTIDGNPPPNPTIYETEEDYNNSFLPIFRHCLDIHRSTLPHRDYQFISIIFHDSNDNELYRKDIPEWEIIGLLNSNNNSDWINIWVEFSTDTKPTKWVVWPYRKNIGWDESPQEGSL